MYLPFIFVKKWIYWRHGVDVSDDVTTAKAIIRVNDMMFSVLLRLCQPVTQNKTIWEGKPV